jgi:hypothetical protein
LSSHEQTAEGAIVSLDRCDHAVGLDGILHVSLSVHLTQAIPVADVRIVLWSDDGSPACDAYTRNQGWSLRLEPGNSVVTLAVGPLRLRRGCYAVSITLLDRSNNLHLYWGHKVRTVEAHGPVAAAVSYTPAVTCLTLDHGTNERRL